MSEITDRELFFVPLDPTEVGLRSACREGFVLDPPKGFASKTGIGGDARSTVEMHAETRQRVQAHGAPVSILNEDSQQLALPGPPAQVWGREATEGKLQRLEPGTKLQRFRDVLDFAGDGSEGLEFHVPDFLVSVNSAVGRQVVDVWSASCFCHTS